MPRTPALPSARDARERVAPWPVALALTVLLAMGFPLVALAQGALPDGVPNVLDPDIRQSYQPYQVGNLEGNPDFPVVSFMARAGQSPAAVLVAVDARNGRESWSLASDPIILIAVFSDARAVSSVYLDSGFARQGAPTGVYTKLTEGNADTLPRLLRTIAAAKAQVYM
jgi:hypothetical protein